MKMNTTGIADIVIKSYSNYAAKKSFKKGQPISILKDVSYSLSFHSENREIQAGIKQLAGYTNYAPYQISINPVNITDSLAEILYKQKINKEKFNLPIDEVQIADEHGDIYLMQTNADGSVLEKDFFILDSKKNIISAAINYEEAVVSGLEKNKKYHLSYYIEKEIDFGYKLGNTNSPYFSLEIKNRDNYGQKGSNTFIRIPKAVLIIQPELDFQKDDITNIPLVFNILDEDIEIIFY